MALLTSHPPRMIRPPLFDQRRLTDEATRGGVIRHVGDRTQYSGPAVPGNQGAQSFVDVI